MPLQMENSEEALLTPRSQSEHLLLGLLVKLEHVLQKMDLLFSLMLQNSFLREAAESGASLFPSRRFSLVSSPSLTWQSSANVRPVPSPASALVLPPDLQQEPQPASAEHASCPSTSASSAGPRVFEWVRGKGGNLTPDGNCVPVTGAVSGGPTTISAWLDVTRLVAITLPLSLK